MTLEEVICRARLDVALPSDMQIVPSSADIRIATAVRAFLGSEEVVAKAAQAIADDLRSRSVYVSDDLRNCLVDGGLFDLHDPARAALSSIMEVKDAR